MKSLGINAIKSQLSINLPLLIGSRLRRTCQIVSIVALVCTGADASAQSYSANFRVLGPEKLVSSNLDGGSLRCEPSVAAAGDTIVVTWNDSYGGHHGSSTGVAIGWAVSRDRGMTFRFGGYLPRSGEAPSPSGADSTVIADAKGTFLLLLVSWEKDVQHLLLYEMNRRRLGKWILLRRYPNDNEKLVVDRPSMLIDATDRLWITFTTYKDSEQQIALIWSDDRGRSWTGPVIPSTGPAYKSASQLITKGKMVTVGWVQLSKISTEIWQAISEDEAKTFSQPTRVSSGKPLSTISGYVMGFSKDAQALYVPNLAIRGSGLQNEIAFVTDLPSENGYEVAEGVLPSGRLTALFPASRSSFFPAVADTPFGLAVLACCRQAETTMTDVCLSIPGKDGRRDLVMLNSMSTDWSNTPGDHDAAPVQRNFGDYVSLTTAAGYLVAVWTDGRNGVPRVFSRVIQLPR
jgi:hypothetical protein